MTDHEALFAAIRAQEKILEKQTEQLSNIEKSLVAIAVQAKEINHLENSVNKLWSSYSYNGVDYPHYFLGLKFN